MTQTAAVKNTTKTLPKIVIFNLCLECILGVYLG